LQKIKWVGGEGIWGGKSGLISREYKKMLYLNTLEIWLEILREIFDEYLNTKNSIYWVPEYNFEKILVCVFKCIQVKYIPKFPPFYIKINVYSGRNFIFAVFRYSDVRVFKYSQKLWKLQLFRKFENHSNFSKFLRNIRKFENVYSGNFQSIFGSSNQATRTKRCGEKIHRSRASKSSQFIQLKNQ
jgi:hypothetical protein